jgi:RecA/RadA recombinase
MQKMLKSSALDNSAVLSKSKFLDRKFFKLPVPMMNVAFSGSFDKGISSGLYMLAGPSKHFKSNMSLVVVAAFQQAYEDGIVLFYDSEFGASKTYFENQGVDPERVLHIPIMNIEELKFDIMKKLEAIDPKTDKVMIFIDSVGNLASKKEVEDAINEKSVADMTRAKQLKSLWRIVTPYLTKNNMVCVAVNHTYDTQEMHSKKVVSGGTGGIYSSNSIFIIGRRQVKDGTDLIGYDFIMNADKSRDIKEKSAIPISVTYEGGINKFSGLLDVALATGYVTKPKNGWFTRPMVEDDKNWRRKDTDSDEFWDPLMQSDQFKRAVEDMFKIGSSKKFEDTDLEGDIVYGKDTEDDIDFDPETGEILE